MKKGTKIILVLLTLLVAVIGVIYLTITPDQSGIKKVEKSVEQYLLEEKDYKSNEIKTISGNYNPKNVGNSNISAYTAHVVFKDEPQVTYTYFIHEGQVTQGGISSPKDQNIHKED
ncbi:DUF3139 domain-containing protein [Lentibacillus amyloliquefaciens]|uniref:DUF3139 domain-containing protein n=1 Tax=Lentibacillus amyloliquefaciens TaxID=1472767 RepID=A0A0U3W7J5_9BACI|nr:DUF3139 domain-containing protein [Lentibacillus amyloliquefaciens]ALX49074.1 hypothetical protein AOX59_10975 [Lentibacillus amyloliquefaciens]